MDKDEKVKPHSTVCSSGSRGKRKRMHVSHNGDCSLALMVKSFHCFLDAEELEAP